MKQFFVILNNLNKAEEVETNIPFVCRCEIAVLSVKQQHRIKPPGKGPPNCHAPFDD